MAQMKKPVVKVKKTQAQIDAALAASKKAAEARRKLLPSKDKRSEIINAQQARINRSKPTATPKPLTGPAAVKALQDRVSPSGVKKAETGAKKAIDKKYPGLYKKK
jgi:hypothetical protein